MTRLLPCSALLILAATACGGGSADLSDCVTVTVDAKSPGLTIVDVYGTAQNESSQDVRYAKVVATCFSASGTVIGRDEEYVENLGVGESKTFDALISDPNQATTRCSAAVEEAR